MDKVLSNDIILYFNKQLDVFPSNPDVVINNLKNNFKPLQVALMYNHILENSVDNKLLSKVIKEINHLKYIDNFSALLTFIKKTDNIDLKVLAIKTISAYKNTNTVPVLMECLNDKNSNYRIRLCAAEALGKIGDKNAFEILGNIASDEDEKSAYVKESAVVALGNLGDNRAIDVFSSILSSKQMFLDKFTYLKERIVEAILKLDVSKNSKAYDILKKSLLDENSCVRISAIEAVMNSQIDFAWDLIYERLINDVDLEVQKNALVALYNISDRKILDNVIQGEFKNELKYYAQEIINEYEDDNE